MSAESMEGNVQTVDPDIEERKLKIEERKLEIEILKARWTAISVIVPILITVITVGWGIASINQQAKLNFQLEAAKTIMTAQTYGDQVARATFLKENFAKTVGK